MPFEPLLPTVTLLGGELIFNALAVLAIFRLRHRLGLGPLFLLLGANQMLSTLLAASVYFRLTPSISISPGSTVLFPTALVAVLLVYLREDIPKTRTLISSVVLINVGGILLLWITAFQMEVLDLENILGVPVSLFAVNGRVFLVGTVVLLLDCLLLLILFQFLERRFPSLPRSVRVTASLVLVLLVDSVLFSVGAFFDQPSFLPVLYGQIVGKGSAGALFGLILSAYLWFFEPSNLPLQRRTESLDVLSILTYQERYEIVRQKLDEAREANLAKSRFLAHMSHELRTPLNAIVGFTKLLTTPAGVPDEEKRRLYLERVHENAHHLLTLINDMLDLSRIEAGKLDIERQRVNVADLVTEMADQMRIQARAKGLEFITELEEDALVVDTDPTRLKQILLNLIGNAIKFTRKGEIRVALRAADKRSKRPARIDIVDTGVGIPPDLQSVIFDAFSQADSSTTKSFEGAGLGLTISQALCQELGYRLEVESREGEGSTFSLVF